MPKKWEISPNRKRQEQYEMVWQWLTYKVFAGRWRKRIMREKKRLESKVMRETLESVYVKWKNQFQNILQDNLNEKYNNWLYNVFGEPKMVDVTPPIEPTVVEKKKFLTPSRFDLYLLYVIVLLRFTLFSFEMISVLMPEPTTNTVIVKVKEKVVYKKPIKKITTNVCNK